MIMNRNNQLFGVIENVEKNNDYNGSSTDTAVVTVDNVNREIRVDVNFEGMLGETNKTAYPGDKGEHTRWLVLHVEDELEAEIERAKAAEYALGTRITDINSDYILGDARVQDNIERTLSSYVTKEDMQEKLSQTTSALKQIVDFVDVENNTIVVNNETVNPIAGITYFVNVKTDEDSEIYKQYALLDGQLTLISDIFPDLTEYAKTEYVDLISATIQQDVDVVKTTYSTKEELHDAIAQYSSSSRVVASSINVDNNTVVINDIVTPAVAGVVYLIAEVTNYGENSYKQYTLIDNKLTLLGGTQIDLSKYATIEYVQSEISKVGTLSIEIVDSIDIDNKTVTINGEIYDVKSGIIYLVLKEASSGSYSQYTVIDDVLTWIGDTNVDLKGYATQEYVDISIDTLNNDIIKLLNNIKFIDGGTASSIII